MSGTAEEALINGKTWSTATSSQHTTAPGSGYILIRTDGAPLNKAKKTELRALGVQIHEFLGGVCAGHSDGDNNSNDNNHEETQNDHEQQQQQQQQLEQQIYLCGYPKDTPLDHVRALRYVDYADEYASDLVIHDAVERVRARPLMRYAAVGLDRGSSDPNTAQSDSAVGGSSSGGGFIAAADSPVVSARLVAAPAEPRPVFDIETEITNSVVEESDNDNDGKEKAVVEVDVLLHHDIVGGVPQELIDKISLVEGLKTLEVDEASSTLRLTIEEAALETVAAFDEVRVIHPVNERVLMMANVARRLLGFSAPEEVSTTGDGVAVAAAPPSSALPSSARYQGRNQLVCVADTGFDKGSATDVHPAFAGRVKALHPWGRAAVTDDPDGHGTHVCGCLLAQGQHAQEGQITGTAPAATLMLQSFFVRFNYLGLSVLGGYPTDLGRLFSQAYDAGARIHTNSWGTPPSAKDNFAQRPYDASAESIDRFVWDHQDMTVLFAAGNDGQDSDLDGSVNERSLGAEASAKNCITVGASENLRPTLTSGKDKKGYTYGLFWPKKFAANPLRDDHQANNPEGLAAFSSRGPTVEGRLKPDLVAPGTAILSARSRSKRFLSGVDAAGVSGDERYQFLSGTSMATPLVAGCCAVVREALLANGYRDVVAAVGTSAATVNPTGSLVKALLINGAVPIKGQYIPENLGDGPNPHSGFGRVNITSTLAMIEPSVNGEGGYGVGFISEETEEPFTVRIPIPSTFSEPPTFKVTMAYADLPGASLANDLNLAVASGGTERHGNQGDQEFLPGSDGPFDRRNNVERVVWPKVGGDSVLVVVKPYRIMLSDVPFAYAWRFLSG